MNLLDKVTAKSWVKYVLIFFISVTFSIFSFNYIIDPYGKQNIFCSFKYKPVLNERGKKYDYIFYKNHIDDYDSLILGSSRVMQIIPSNSPLTKSFYNFSVHVANNAEKLFILKEWLKRKKLKTVYLGIDYYNFHKNKGPLNISYSKFQNYNSGNYLSISATKLSYKSLKNQLQDSPQTFFNKDGSINYYNKDKLIKNNQYDFSKKTFQIQSKGFVQNNLIKDPFVIEDKVFDTLQKIKKLSIKYNFKLYIFITPMQQEVINQLKQYPNILKKYKYIDKKLVKIFTKVYNFAIENTYNNERKNFYDPFHYRAILGDKIVSVLNNNSNDYGKILK